MQSRSLMPEQREGNNHASKMYYIVMSGVGENVLGQGPMYSNRAVTEQAPKAREDGVENWIHRSSPKMAKLRSTHAIICKTLLKIVLLASQGSMKCTLRPDSGQKIHNLCITENPSNIRVFIRRGKYLQSLINPCA